ncbi:hypothetical protein RDWZM_003603 [Blomia tropicalis]|uniref:SRP54-type proteins GTP-binding domain-containing protein n=1 Tax=Blomia tropicalis TaxID=40697 RepID=A0A9Q0MH80_BLOTA|nr:hypothetical protein BLOT_002839 [Blomia tropicalis]KAJ6225058.1 hypothetical protein RDWZM_003603 [Blomia tropicalis]
MLDLFAIFSKSGIVLFATVNSSITNLSTYLNRIIQNVILEDRVDKFQVDTLVLQYCLDNEFELVFVVGYQKMLSLSYIDKFLDDMQLAFRDKYKDYDLRTLLRVHSQNGHKPVQNLSLDGDIQAKVTKTINGLYQDESLKPIHSNLIDFIYEFGRIYSKCNRIHQQNGARPQVTEMRSFDQSQKSKKTVQSMIIQSKNTKPNDAVNKPPINEDKQAKPDDIFKKLVAKNQKNSPKVGKKPTPKVEAKKKNKKPTVWEFGGRNDANLDFSKKVDYNEDGIMESSVARNIINVDNTRAEIDMQPDLEFDDSSDEDDHDEQQSHQSEQKQGFFGSIMNSFSVNKTLSMTDLEPILSNLRDHLISKNVAVEIATKLCDSVAAKLEGQNVNTWMGLKGFVRNALEESILRILSPNRNLNILREVQVKNDSGNPYVIVFCGVNGVGKSTNLAKIANWLLINGSRVLVIACDTFRAGAIEQLRTHIHALKNIHDGGKIELFEKGYGKDSTGIAMEGIRYAHNMGYNVCLVDTAGRMQGNEPLMKQLAKLIKVNEPDLTLFVGEALVGNEAVDQLVNFNKALIDNGCRSATNGSVSAINGIVLTKFDTIDDQVGAAISMTYITGQPIVFVGVGQTYRDLKQLNARAVVRALMK